MGSLTHEFSGTHFLVESSAAGSTETWSRGSAVVKEKLAYVVGSGSHGFGYLIQLGDHLFQSPLSFYTGRKQWDMAPGYERARAPDFSRVISVECLLCHAGKPQPIPDTLNRYEDPPFAAMGISCDRCHGPAEQHLKKFSPGSIVNPAKLTGAARDSVCEQCHLAGEARIPNPGKTIADFKPGQKLEDTFTVFVAAQPAGTPIKVVSHVEQLAASVCARSSQGKLWCGYCHDPHRKPTRPAVYFRERCLTCHAGKLASAHAAPGRDCVSCHMPQEPTRDGGHTAFTNHRIMRVPSTDTKVAALAQLTPWREPELSLRDRNLALALTTNGIQESDVDEVIQGYRLLSSVEDKSWNDPAVLTALGSVLLQAKQPSEALRRFERSLALRPAYAPYEINVAAALQACEKPDEAIVHLEKALVLDPLIPSAVDLLSRLYRQEGKAGQAEDVLSAYRAKWK